MQSIQKTCDLHEKMAATGMFHLEKDGGDLQWKRASSAPASTAWFFGGYKLTLDPPSYLPDLLFWLKALS